MAYTVEALETSRCQGFRPRNVFGVMLKEFLNLSDGLKILDLGCGTGFFTRILAEQCKADIIGMDINEELLEGAQRIAGEKNHSIRFEKGDITSIPYEDETFDIVMCDIMLECFEDTAVPLQEMKRVCKTGGVVAAIEPFYQLGFAYFPEVDLSMRDLIMKYSRADRAFGLGPMLPSCFYEIGLSDIDLVSWFWGRIGFRDLETETIDMKLSDMHENIERMRNFLPRSKQVTLEEQSKVIDFYEQRFEHLKHNPEKLKSDMSVSGVPAFIVKGIK